MDFKSLLNKDQFAAVETQSQYVRIIAGAGSGKTRVLTYRIAYLVAEHHVEPNRILAIAFTNKVANEMKDRAQKLVEQLTSYFANLHISTFHSFCARFLRSEAKAIGYPSGFTIYDEDDQTRLIRSIGEGLGYRKGDPIIKTATQYIRRSKNKGLYPEDISIKNQFFKEEKECLKFYTLYEQQKESMFALDFDDLLLKTIRILKEFSGIREKWASRYDHILVDEFQDTNNVQYQLIRFLLRPDSSVYVVGDPDQTIYTWRGANQNIIMDFQKDFSPVETVILDRNYRSTEKILKSANVLIAKNKKRIPKNLYTEEKGGDDITLYRGNSAEEEAVFVASKIETLADKDKDEQGNANYSDIAVLYRSSYMTRPFEAELASRGIPYRIFGGLRFYERKEVKDLLAYFNLLLNEKDNIAFERIINVPKRGIGDTSVERIRSEAAAANVSEYEYLRNFAIHGEDSELQNRVVTAMDVLIGKMEDTKKKLTDKFEAYSGILRDFITSIGYFDYLKDIEEVDEDRVGNVNAMFDDITSFIKNHPESTFDEYLQNVTLLTSQDDMNEGNYVSLMTIHVSKGLEFNNVFVISMNQGSFPSMRSEDENGRDGKEEERRLCYVAMTRAKKKLFMSCNSGYSYVTDSRAMPSEFFEDAELKFPRSGYTPYNNSGYSKQSYDRSYQSHNSFFGDGGHISPFVEPEAPKKEPIRDELNGINDWKVGDRAHHEKFGDGVVSEVISESIIVITFESCGKKTLLSTHPMLSRLSSKGGQA